MFKSQIKNVSLKRRQSRNAQRSQRKTESLVPSWAPLVREGTLSSLIEESFTREYAQRCGQC